ncbi:hypothetical protein cypCar_00041022, partial [Cyprinus carpio]
LQEFHNRLTYHLTSCCGEIDAFHVTSGDETSHRLKCESALIFRGSALCDRAPEALTQSMARFHGIRREIRRIHSFSVNVTLDAKKAHSYLKVSQDGKEVRDTRAGHDIPCGPQQFNLAGGVLGKPDITSGRAFWVVEVGNNVGWELGVMRDGGKREGYVSYKPSKSYWAIMLCAQNMYRALEDPPVQLHLETKPRKLGVFVDCEEALVSFYDMEALSHIYSFTHCSFKRAIRPFFNPHPNEDGSNSSPLVICPLNQTDISV